VTVTPASLGVAARSGHRGEREDTRNLHPATLQHCHSLQKSS
jgi:hypothetical protein